MTGGQRKRNHARHRHDRSAAAGAAEESPLQERLRILRESTGSATLTPNAETYVKRAAELVHNEEGPVGPKTYDRRMCPQVRFTRMRGGHADGWWRPVWKSTSEAVELGSRRWRGGGRDQHERAVLISPRRVEG